MYIEHGLFSLAYAGSVRYYAAMLACRKSLVSIGEKRSKLPWCTNHCNIIGANGLQTLTLPLVKPIAGVLQSVSDVELSEHGDWRRVHWGALFSAYGKSPFFEYIADDLLAVYENHDIKDLLSFNTAIHNIIVDFLDLPIDVTFSQEEFQEGSTVKDFRRQIGENKEDKQPFIQNQEYWQVWKGRHGFKPDLSIFDLLMNQGRESIFILQKMITP